MPSRRTTKTVRRTLTNEDEDSLKEIPLLLRDLDGQLKSILKKCEDSANFVVRKIATRHKQSLNTFDHATRAYSIEALFSCQTKEEEDPKKTSCNEIDVYISSVKSTVKSTSKSRRVAGGSTVRKSTRKRVAETPIQSRSAQNLATPLNKMHPMNLGRTPMITPKFDTMTPFTRTLHRQARPNETLVSLSGSPVMATVKKTGRGKAKEPDAANYAQIPLSDNMVLSVPMTSDFQVDGLELDEDQINKLTLIQQGLTNMLKGRIGSSESE